MLNINPKNYGSECVLSKEELLSKLAKLRGEGKKIGFCSGSFDLLHPGQITHLISAKKQCDALVVGVAADVYSSQKKVDSGRPIFSEQLRSFMVSQLKPVDFVFIDEDGSSKKIFLVRPDVYIKGKDYSDGKDPTVAEEKRIIESYGGRMCYTDDEKLSTTEIIEHIKEKIN